MTLSGTPARRAGSGVGTIEENKKKRGTGHCERERKRKHYKHVDIRPTARWVAFWKTCFQKNGHRRKSVENKLSGIKARIQLHTRLIHSPHPNVTGDYDEENSIIREWQ